MTAIAISELAVQSFFADLRSVLESLDAQDLEELYLVSKNRDALAVSYDGALHPFLGRTHGRNSEHQRIRDLDENLAVLELIKAALRARRKSGGRVFLTSRRVFYVEDKVKVPLLEWDWPGKDLVSKARAFKRAAQRGGRTASGAVSGHSQ